MNTEYNFDIQYGELKAKSPGLITRPQGISLYFLRAGMFWKKGVNSYLYQTKPLDTNFPPDRLSEPPVLDDFYNAEAILNKGYLYVIDETHKDGVGTPIYHEYQVEDNGSLVEIKWTKGNIKDKRIPLRDAESYRCLTFPAGTVVWVAYSPVQWSLSYFAGFINNATKRAERMVKVECKGIIKKEDSAQGGILSYKNVHPRFPMSKEETVKDSKCLFFNQILIDVRNQELMEDKKGDNEVFEDMFVVLNDPIGGANDVACILENAHKEMEALITAIQTGLSPEYIKSEGVKDIPPNQEAMSLHLIALSLYHLLYDNDKESLKKYKEKIKEGSVEKLLAVEERAKLRVKIDNLRNNFGSFLCCNYYHNSIADIYNAEQSESIEGEEWIAEHHGLLAKRSYDLDRALDRPSTIPKPEDDRWKTYIENSFYNENNSLEISPNEGELKIKTAALFRGNLDIEKIDGKDIANACITAQSTAEIVADIYTGYAITRPERLDMIVKFVGKCHFGSDTYDEISDAAKKRVIREARKNGTPISKDATYFVVGRKNFREMLKEKGVSFDELQKQGKVIRTKSLEKGRKQVLIEVSKGVDIDHCIVEKKISLDFISNKPNKTVMWIQMVQDSRLYVRISYAFSIFNLVLAIDKFRNSKSFIERNANGAYLVSAGFGIMSLLGRINALRIAKMTIKLGNVGMGIGVAATALDVINYSKNKDYDAALCTGLATLLSAGMLTAMCVKSIIIAASVAAKLIFTISISIAGVLLIVLLILACSNEDDPLEAFIIQGVLGREYKDYFGLIEKKESLIDIRSWEYVKQLCEKPRNQENKIWKDYSIAYENIRNLLMCYNVQHRFPGIDYTVGKKEAIMLHTSFYTSVEILCTSYCYKENISKSEIYLYVFLDGLTSNTPPIEIRPNIPNGSFVGRTSEDVPPNIMEFDDSNFSVQITYYYKFKKDIIDDFNLATKIVAISRFIIDEENNEFFPSSIDEKEYYLGYYFSPIFREATSTPTGVIHRSNGVKLVQDAYVRIGAKDELLTTKNI